MDTKNNQMIKGILLVPPEERTGKISSDGR